MPLRFLTAGESHGPALPVLVEGLPAGVPVVREAIDRDLRRRMRGYGRGGRMKIEADRVEIHGGVRFSRTLGSPVSLGIVNRDHENWLEAMAVDGSPPEGAGARPVTRPRPGHADLAGALKYGTHDARETPERASAREPAARAGAGALARPLLAAAGIEVTSRTLFCGQKNGTVCDNCNFGHGFLLFEMMSTILPQQRAEHAKNRFSDAHGIIAPELHATQRFSTGSPFWPSILLTGC